MTGKTIKTSFDLTTFQENVSKLQLYGTKGIWVGAMFNADIPPFISKCNEIKSLDFDGQKKLYEIYADLKGFSKRYRYYSEVNLFNSEVEKLISQLRKYYH